jgi:hypothetical protein
MRIGVTGPNKLFAGSLKERQKLLEKAAEIIAKSGNEIILTPDKGSLLQYFGEKYLEFGGKKIFIVAPTEEKDYKDYLNTDLGDVISCIDWARQANEFCEQSQIMVCLGYGWGVMKEIACAQYYGGENKKKVYIAREFVSEELPEELNFLVEYISLEEFGEKIKNE